MSDELTEQSHPRQHPLKTSGMFANLRIVSLGTLLSRILGLLRDMGMASLFGAGTTLDAFIVAFRVPNLARQLLGEGALSTAFLPVFIRSREEQGDAAARSTLWAVSIVLTWVLAGIVLLAELGLAAIWWRVDLSESSRLLLVLTALMIPYMMLICLAALLCAALHALRQFVWPTMVPIILNTAWLIAILITKGLPATPHQQAMLLAGSVTLAGILQLIAPLIVLNRLGFGPVRAWQMGWPHVRDVFQSMIPVVAGMSLVQTSALFDSLLAWSLARPDDGASALCESWGIPPVLESGTAAALYMGQRMYQFPLGIFGVALGTVLYPILTQHAQRREFDLLRQDLVHGMKIVIAVALPASAGLYLLADPLTIVLFRHGEFNSEDAQLTSRMIAIYGAGVWSSISLAILNRAFYSIGDRITPMRFGMLALTVNIVLNLILVFLVGGSGLALGSVLATVLQVGLTLWKLNRNVGPLDWKTLQLTLVKGLCSSVLMIIACLTVMAWLPPPNSALTKLMLLGVPCLVGAAVYLLSARLTGMSELEDLLRRS